MSSSPSPNVSHHKRKGKTENVTSTNNETSAESNSNEAPPAPQPGSKLKSLVIRTIAGIIMLVGFLFLLRTSHVVVSGFVILLQVLVYREMVSLRFKEAKERNLMAFRTLNWYVDS